MANLKIQLMLQRTFHPKRQKKIQARAQVPLRLNSLRNLKRKEIMINSKPSLKTCGANVNVFSDRQFSLSSLVIRETPREPHQSCIKMCQISDPF